LKVAFWNIGRTDESYLEEGIRKYEKRLSNYLSFEYKEIKTGRGKKIITPAQHRLSEKEEIFKLLKPNDYLVLLDEGGKSFGSVTFSTYLEKLFHEVQGSLIFLAGGPYGFDETLYQRANAKLSLSEMTFTHQMVRLIFLEQLYRAMTILRNEPYHH
jgi:23S rRNA (pseudouridine1915-N3)-methyltransferase